MKVACLCFQHSPMFGQAASSHTVLSLSPRIRLRVSLYSWLVGAEVTELIQGYTVAKTMETTEQELMQTVFPHPTLSEMMHESVLDAYGRAIHF